MKPGAVIGGRYRVVARLGKGGMGEVWRCVDLERGAAVAIKTLHTLQADQRRLFQQEVHATARLDHPNIVGVYDLVREGGELALVMELRDGHPLHRWFPLPFEALREAACQVLDALAYAHSRGVLHLDIKPANVLLEPDPIRATLLDFGIARAWRGEAPETGDAILGTMPYMPPEQLLMSHERLGPWSDLFAFGATLYRMASGVRPFEGWEPTERLRRRPARIETVAPRCPEALGELLALLLAPEPERRPSHAADVLAALRELPRIDGPLVRPGEDEEDETTTASATIPGELTIASGPPAEPTGSLPPPEAPEDVAAPVEAPEPGAYALFGLRELPVLGRLEERRAIWEQLVAAREREEVRVVVLRGPSGAGKTRLARDAMERAHQVGLAHTAWTSWRRGGPEIEGLRRLVAHAVSAGGGRSTRRVIDFFLARFPGPDDARLRTELSLFLAPGDALTDADLGLRVTTAVLGRLASERAAVIALDEADASGGVASALIRRLRESAIPCAVLLTLGDADDDGAPPDLALRLDTLDDAASARLVRGLLDVDDALATLVAARAGGNPLVATQLVEELIEDDAIARVGGRYALRPERDPAALPADLDAIWARRVARAGVGLDLAAFALTRARVDEDVAGRLVRARGEGLVTDLRRAERAGLLSMRDGAFEWVHASLREHLIARVPDAERAALHREAADALEVRVGAEDVQAERAAHLHGAGAIDAACEAMIEACAWSSRRGEEAERERRAERLLSWARTDAHRARAHAELAHVAVGARNLERAEAHLAEARACAAGSARPWVAFRETQVATFARDAERVEGAAREALTLAREEGDAEVETLALGALGLAARRRGDPDDARACFEACAALARARGDLVTEARATTHLGNLAPTESLPLFERAIELAQRAGARLAELTARQVYADALYGVGETTRAFAEMQTVVSHARTLGLRPYLSIFEIQLACWALKEGDVDRAAHHLAEAVDAGCEDGSVAERCMCAALGAAVATLRGETASALGALSRLAEVRGEYDEPELREVLEAARPHAEGALAAAIERAISPTTPPT